MPQAGKPLKCLNVSGGLAGPQGVPGGGHTSSYRLGYHPAGLPPASPAHLQNLISLLDALPVCRAARLHPGHEDAHVIASGQPQPNVCALEESDHPRGGAVPEQ